MYLSTFAFLEHRFGPDAKGAVLARLDDADRALLSGLLLPFSWYPLPPFGRLLRAMEGEFGRGDYALVTERGVWTATRDLHTLRKAILKLVTVPWIITKSGSLWPQFHDTGRWVIQKTADDQARAELRDFGVVAAVCASIRGWIIGLAMLTKPRKVDVRHTACRAKGDAVCAYEVRWA